MQEGSGGPDCGLTFFNHIPPQGNRCTNTASVLDAGWWKPWRSTEEAERSHGASRQKLGEGCGNGWLLHLVWGDLSVAWEGDPGVGAESFCPLMEVTVFLTRGQLGRKLGWEWLIIRLSSVGLSRYQLQGY